MTQSGSGAEFRVGSDLRNGSGWIGSEKKWTRRPAVRGGMGEDGSSHRSRIRYLSKKFANFPKLKKFVKCLSRAAAGTRVINYPGNLLLPDGTGTRVVNI